MAQFDASVVVNVITKGEQRLNQIKASVNEINRLSQNLKPINLLSPGGGKLGDSVKAALKPIKDFAREAVNGTQRYSNTLSGATGQAQIFKTVLDNVKIAAGGYDKQVADVKNYAAALAGAEKQARELAERQRDLLTDARTRAGIAPQGQSTLLGSDEAFQARAAYDARLAAERALSKETSRRLFIEQEIADVALQAAKLREIEAKRLTSRRSKGKLTENLFLGAGFPLLFGGGAGAVGGGVLGSLLSDDGFGGQIFLSALGTALDEFAKSTANLGAELNKAKPDVDAITERLGVVGTGTEAYINALQDSDQATKAAQAATDELAQLVGQDGVRALKDFGAQTTELGNELAKAFTLIAAAAAKIISQSSAFKEIQTQLPRAVAFQQAKNSDNPEIQRLFSELEGTNAFLPGGSAKRAELGDKIIEKQLEINRLREEGNRLAAEGVKIAANEAELEIQSEKLIGLKKEALEASGDARLVALAAVAEEEANAQFLLEKQELINRAIAGEISFRAVALKLQGKQIDLAETLKGIEEGLKGKLDRGGSAGGGVDKEAQVQKTLAGLRTKSFEIDTKLIAIGATKLDQLEIEMQRITALQALKRAEIELSKEDQRIKDLKLANLSKEFSLLFQQKELQRERLQLEKEIIQLKGEQQLAGLQRGLDQELAGLALPTGDVFGDAQQQLATEQANRYANVMADINDQIEQQRILATSSDAAIAESANQKLGILERQKGVYETMLPAIAQAEQAQLQFNQVLSVAQGPVNAFVNGLTSGLQGIIDGTKSVEEAFADMLKGIGAALVQEGAKMIAQYIAIGIARAFAGMGGSTFGSQGTQIQSDFGNFFRGATSAPGFSTGGFVGPNRVALVGEQGPELIQAGPTGATVTSNPQSESALSKYGPGNESMAAASTPGNYNINYNGPTLNFNGDDYIPRSEAGQLVAAGAKQGEARTLNSLRNQRSTRSRIGI